MTRSLFSPAFALLLPCSVGVYRVAPTENPRRIRAAM